MILVQAGAVFAIGLLPYLCLPLRAIAGPAEVYGPFLTLEWLFAHISGAQFRGDMHFLSLESVRAAWAAMPQVIDHLVATSNVVFVVLGVFGIALLVLRDRWFGALLVVLGVVNVYFYANYLGDLSHYLLATWLILAIGLAISVETRGGRRRAVGPRRAWVAFAMLVLPVVLLTSNWASHDQSANHDGERFTEEVFAALPAGRGPRHLLGRPDAAELQALRGGRPARCQAARLRRGGARDLRPGRAALTDVARRRPVFGLMVDDGTIAADDRADPGAGASDQVAVGPALSGARPDALPAGTRRPGSLRWQPGMPLLDVGGGARLERFGARVIDRPHPAALGYPPRSRGLARARPALRSRPRMDRCGWRDGAEPWPIEIDGLTLELRATDAGQVGLFPEHAAMLPWLREQVAGGAPRGRATNLRRCSTSSPTRGS